MGKTGENAREKKEIAEREYENEINSHLTYDIADPDQVNDDEGPAASHAGGSSAGEEMIYTEESPYYYDYEYEHQAGGEGQSQRRQNS
ncbi:hypothetical protein ACHAPS_008551 [Verticillium nonalfalfae]